jgi:hypothetical protein
MQHVNQLKKALQDEGMKLSPPPELKRKVLSQISTHKGLGMKKRAAALLIALFIIPTSALAYQSILADGVYGSFENVKKHIATATFEGYMMFDAKLSQAKGELGEKDYEAFRHSINILTDAKLEYGDKYGNINFELMTKKEKEKIRNTSFVLQPYFDRLNGDVSSKELLSPYEYSLFIDALITYETILSKAEINTSDGPVEIESLPAELQDQFAMASNMIQHVYSLQKEYKESH